MVYANYEYYKESYYGTTISEEDFPRLALRASAFLDYCTMGRAERNPELEPLRMACCAVAEQQQIIDQAQALAARSLASASTDSAELQSESVGSWSRSYRSGGDSAAAALKATQDNQSTLLEIARIYLGNTGLLMARGFRA